VALIHDVKFPPSAHGRPPALAANAMVATSQPTATAAGLRILGGGGNAVDAAVAAAAVLSVSEPMSTGPGGDLFALVWRDGVLEGLDAAGPAPRSAPAGSPVEESGPRSINVPGAVAGWAAMSGRHGRLGLDECLSDAVTLAREGFAVGARCAHAWQLAPHLPDGFGPVPDCGARVRLPELAATFAALAEGGAERFYTGAVAEAICSVSWLEPEDLEAMRPRWVEPLQASYHNHQIVELPPPTQGVAVLEGLLLLAGTSGSFADRITCCRLALEDALREVRDGAEVDHLLEPAAIVRRLGQRPASIAEPAGGTIYLCVVDADGMAVSLVQSLYESFGSGVVAPGTGVVLHNRGACFAVEGEVTPGRRPYHTIIPGMIINDGQLLGPFGVMGGFIQAQAHVQFLHSLLDDGVDPQTALDRPRFRVEGERVLLEQGLWDSAAMISELGLEPVRERAIGVFGGGQAIVRTPYGTLMGGSDGRKDGYAAGW
jgi:gamma-glutamyltranspeptidase / glutathione hydrolase